jgi:hypothetical protein
MATGTPAAGKASGDEALPRRSTLLALVQLLQNRFGLPEDQVVAVAAELVNSGRVVLSGNFAGQTLH